MAAGDTLLVWTATADMVPGWRTVAFTSGGTHEVLVGDTLTGGTSGSTAVVVAIKLRSGTWAGGDAAGYLVLKDQDAAFQSEVLDEGANSDVCTIAADTNLGYATFGYVNGKLVKDFDDTAIELVLFDGVMPQHYAGGGVTVTLWYYGMSGSNTSAFVVVDVAWQGQADGDDAEVDGFGDFNSATEAVPDAANEIDPVAVSFSDGTDMDSVGAGSPFLVLVVRDGASSGDDAIGDWQLAKLEVTEQ